MKPTGAALVCAGLMLINSSVLRADPVRVLDQTAPLRCYYRFATDLVSPAALKGQGPKVLGAARYLRLRRSTEKSLGRSGNDAFAVFRPSPLVLR